MPRWVFITGGVLSGLGKGLVSASVAKLLQTDDRTIIPVKCDGYLNVDPGTMNPHEHGEVFVLDDGGEVDMDFGHYERFLDIDGKTAWNLTSGKVFQSVIEQERAGDYLGETVQMVPHVTDEIKSRFRSIADEEDADIVIVEVGGTVGDMENMMYLEAIRQIHTQSDDPSALIHTTLVPYLETVGEQKTKPTQHSVKELQRAGLKPDFIIGRSDDNLAESTKEKIALFCDVDTADVISDPDIDTVYRLPLVLRNEGLDTRIVDKLGLTGGTADLTTWRDLVQAMQAPDHVADVALVGKYTDMDDSYVSIEEALRHAAAHHDAAVRTTYVDATDIDTVDDAEAALSDFDGVIIAPGFGERGTDGKITAAQYCREHDVPTLGICFGLQMMVVEYAKHVCDIDDAASGEFADGDAALVVDQLPEQVDVDAKGGTMRLGGYTARLVDGTQVRALYDDAAVVERHRHRYEVNPDFHDTLKEHGLVFSGTSADGTLVEFIELPAEEHPFYVGTQAHPEFTSRLEYPNPLYNGFVTAILPGPGM